MSEEMLKAIVEELQELSRRVDDLATAFNAILDNHNGLQKDRDLYLSRLGEAREAARHISKTMSEHHERAHEERATQIETALKMGAEITELKLKVAALEKKTKNL